MIGSYLNDRYRIEAEIDHGGMGTEYLREGDMLVTKVFQRFCSSIFASM